MISWDDESCSRYSIQPYILAGGAGKRLGLDKKNIRFNGKTLLENTIETVENVFKRKPDLVGNNISPPDQNNYKIIPDIIEGKGPLGGLISALLNRKSHTFVFTLPTDLPLITENEIRILLTAADDNHDAIVFRHRGIIQPLSGLFHHRTLPFWKQRLAQNLLSIRNGIKILNCKFVDIPNSSSALFNLNTISDLDHLRKLF
ncbi:molybdenum cofactor guanylyltransferase [bacterium]|nr:molybdenum cofactor guanylyltransferase [bacterium]